MAIVNLKEMKDYLRVDFDDDDELITAFIKTAQKLCMDIGRTDNEEIFSSNPSSKTAVMYAAAYLYDHREEADHHALTMTLRSLLSSMREGIF